MTLDESVHGMRLRVIERAQALGNVSAVCRELGISRTVYYRWRQPPGTLRGRRRASASATRPGRAPDRDGPGGGAPRARDRDQRGHLGLPTDRRLPGPDLAGAPGAQHRATAAASGRARHAPRAADGARAAGGPDGGAADRTHSANAVARPPRPHPPRRGERAGRAAVPGHLLHRQSQGRRQGLADHRLRRGDIVRAGRLLPAHDAEAAATFLRVVVVPHFQRAGWPVRRVLTDGGPEFKGAFDVACRQLGLRHTRTKPRHAWTNGFVERLQGTILQELWRVAFRRRYFTTRAALQRALDGFMRYYNTERPHRGYRVRGRTPAALLWGVAAQ